LSQKVESFANFLDTVLIKATGGHPDVEESEAGNQRAGKDPAGELLRALLYV
jgi:hypothetical protein